MPTKRGPIAPSHRVNREAHRACCARILSVRSNSDCESLINASAQISSSISGASSTFGRTAIHGANSVCDERTSVVEWAQTPEKQGVKAALRLRPAARSSRDWRGFGDLLAPCVFVSIGTTSERTVV